MSYVWELLVHKACNCGPGGCHVSAGRFCMTSLGFAGALCFLTEKKQIFGN